MSIFSEDATKILEKRYLLKDPAGRLIETPEQMLYRVARTAAAAEGKKDRAYWEEKFYKIMADKRFLPNSPALANAGRAKGQLAACFVLPVPDSIEGIFETMKRAALIHKTGGGTGFSFSGIRPKDDVVSSTGGVASGPVPFIAAYNCATDAIKQGGMRRGANMAVLDYWHPDIMEFISSKEQEGALANFNISVGADRKFMAEVERDGEIEFLNPRTGRPAGKKVRAGEIMDAIASAAWANGEPGILFFDHINHTNSVPGCGPIRATNPCGEQPLQDYESCNLGSLNLLAYLKPLGSNRSGTPESGKNGINFTERIDWGLLGQDITTAVRFLDNIIDVNYYVFPETEEITLGNRKIGLGVMGFADLLIELGIPYASEESLQVIEGVMSFIGERARTASALLGREKGSFPNIKKSIYRDREMRNATVTTIAPTGTLSMLADTSSGIEPLFGLSYIKEVLEGKQFAMTNRRFEAVARERGFWSEALQDEIGKKGSLGGIEGIPEDVRGVFATAFEIPAEWHVRIQAAFQKYVDNAVSKTVNFPHEAGTGDVRSVYMLAWKLGCKGITIYRTGSRINQVLRFKAKDRINGETPGDCRDCQG
ncbi:MAG: ribonucleoside-diphosphate reductase, adenosylcobalamin-dependent [Firmicutes bacterium HGW-Firmicutes-14]|jgi:ribonucleoside-diphosphate reductase alpha chain|nr:MAG: ribonucleoside-diphosphate reductase, adenosylcobalamin-dependent [Firmicutes bacterium HGW-Firmicutes-14]